MLPKIKERLDTTPFRPFTLRTVDGREYPVPTVDHIYLPPGSRDVIVTDDRGVTALLSSFYIAGLVDTLSSALADEAPSES